MRAIKDTCTLEQDLLTGIADCGGPTLKQSYAKGLQSIERTHEELNLPSALDCWEDKTRLFTAIYSRVTRSNGHEMKQERCFPMKTFRQ